MNGYRRTSSLGCLGMFSIVCLTIFSLAEIGLLLRINPDWFDRRAWWRGARLDAEAAVLADPVWLAKQGNEPRPVDGGQDVISLPRKLELIESHAMSVDVQRGNSAKLERPEGAVLDIPAGALAGQSGKVKMTPVKRLPGEMGSFFAGPVYQIEVNGQKEGHYRFASPVNLTLPYIPRAVEGEKVTVAVFDNGVWTPVPTQVDEANGVVRASIPHASLWSTIVERYGMVPVRWLGQLAVGGHYAITTGTGRGNIRAIGSWWNNCKTYATTNFKIHYYEAGEDSVPSDSKYGGLGGRTPRFVNKTPPFIDDGQEHVPLYVQDIGAVLEDCRVGLEKMGLDLPEVRRLAGVKLGLRYDVFIIKQGSLGESMLNGPILIANDMDHDAAEHKLPFDKLLRATLAHELVHVAQGSYFSFYMAGRDIGSVPATDMKLNAGPIYSYASWIECSAAYWADRFWEDRGMPTDIVRDYDLTADRSRLCSVPFDYCNDMRAYAYARFFQWIDKNYRKKGLEIVKAVNESHDPTLASLEAAAHKVMKDDGETLGTLFKKFSTEFYYSGQWDGKLFPAMHQGPQFSQVQNQTAAIRPPAVPDNEYTFLRFGGKLGTYDTPVNLKFWGLAPLTMRHMTCRPLYYVLEKYPDSRKARLVINIEPAGGGSLSPHISATIAQDTVAGMQLPISGAPAGMRPLQLDPRRTTEIIDLFKKKDINRITLLLFNTSSTVDAGDVDVTRWLLMAPSFVNYSRDGDPPSIQALRWTVSWQKAELSFWPRIFAGYNVYRKKLGEPDTAYQLVKEGVMDEVYTDHVTDEKAEYVYTVRVRDYLGNLSEPADAEASDPFVGTWEGELQLVDGELMEYVVRKIGQAGTSLNSQEQAEINKIKEPAERARRQAEWDKVKAKSGELWGPIEQLLLKVEFLLRVGVPMKFEIRGKNGKYFLRLTEVAWKPTELTEKDEVELVRTGRFSVQFKDVAESEFGKAMKEGGLKPIELSLVRAVPISKINQIRQDSYILPANQEIEFKGAEIKWHFERKEKK